MGQEITLPEHIKVIIWNGFWTRQDAIDNPDKLFLFGGNVLQDIVQTTPRVPKSTQAVIRGLPNTWAIPTKWTSALDYLAYFDDQKDLEDFKELLHKVNFHLQFRLQMYKAIVLSKDGIGTGKAKLQEEAPKCWELLQTFLAPLYERAEKSVISED